jgi:hypothetical protein
MAVAGLGLAATLVGLATGIADLGDRLFPDPKVKDPNVEIVLDRSAAMASTRSSGARSVVTTSRYARSAARATRRASGWSASARTTLTGSGTRSPASRFEESRIS